MVRCWGCGVVMVGGGGGSWLSLIALKTNMSCARMSDFNCTKIRIFGMIQIAESGMPHVTLAPEPGPSISKKLLILSMQTNTILESAEYDNI